MKYLLIFIVAFWQLCCKNEGRAPELPELKKSDSNADTFQLPISLFWQQNCHLPEFKKMFDCNKEENNYYQIELSHDPFKEFATISLIFKNNNISEIYRTNLYFTGSLNNFGYKNYRKNTYCILNKRDTLYCFYNGPKKIRLPKILEKESQFFNETLWALPDREDEKNAVWFDPEVWSIKGRKNGRENRWMRQTFQDSIYYSTIQNILTICQVKNYKYLAGQKIIFHKK